MTNRFDDLLEGLGKEFHLKLHTDKSNACTIQIHPGLTVQIQLDSTQENIWIFSKLIEIPPGKFRENVLKETLKANGLAEPRVAVFGYINASNTLALFQKYPLNILTGQSLSGLIGAFVEMASTWMDAIGRGQSAPPK